MPDSTAANRSPAASSERAPSERLVSLDALRGFDMFWILGGDKVIHALHKALDVPATALLATQMTHKEWEGFAFYDLIFPLFVFIAGASLVFSLGRIIEERGRGAALLRIARRAALLYILGIFYYGGLATPFLEIRLLGVLQRIALCYFFAGLAFVVLRPRGLVGLCVALLLLYWGLMTFVPIPAVGAGNYAEGQNLANYVDSRFLPLRKWDGTHDPEGLLSTLPAIATCLLGVFAGMLLRDPNVRPGRRVLYLAAGGAVLASLGWAWHLQFPVIKKIWTSSYVLVAGGYSSLLLAAFYLVIDVVRLRFWAAPFVWIGMNAITLYLARNLVDFGRIAQRFAGGDLNRLLGAWGEFALAAAAVLLLLGLARFLYRREIFLRL